ncbi:MAG: helix-turn-helix domain-containing protein [Phycisphaeraceae bacterium]
MNANAPRFLTIRDAAAELGVPTDWLRAEAAAGRVPCLHAGRATRVNPEAVARALDERANKGNAQAVRDE